MLLMKTSSREIRSQVSQLASTVKGADLNALQAHAHHCMTPAKQWTWVLCSVIVIPANKLSLQEVNQLMGIELLASGFLEIFGSSSQFTVG